MANTFTKLRDGTWGVRVDSHVPLAGETVTVIRKDGSEGRVKIAEVFWTGANRFGPGTVSLCVIEAEEKPAAAAPVAVPPIRRPAAAQPDAAPVVASPGTPVFDDEIPF